MELTTKIHHADLCVVGGGLAGMCAAISASRGGSKVVLIGDRPVLGGNASSEIRMWVCGADGENNRETGIIEEISLKSLYRNPDKLYPIWDGILYETVKNEPNITLLLNCSVCRCEMDGEHIVSVTGWQTTTQQWHTVYAPYFSDCSGDSILAPLTGADFRVGREAASEFGEKTSQVTEDRQTMGMSCLIQMRKTSRATKFIPPDRDDAQPAQRRAADEIEQHRFQIVVGGVRRGDEAIQRREKRIAHPACGFFDAFAGFSSARGDVSAGDGEGNAPILTQLADERFVAVRFRAAQMVIIVRGTHSQAQLVLQRAQAVQHRHGVRAAGDGTGDGGILRQRLRAPESEHLIPHASTPDWRTW